MKNLGKKEENIIFFEKKDFKKDSITNRFLYIGIKSLLYIILLFLITISLNILKNETNTSFENGNTVTYLKKEMVDKFNLYINNCFNDILIDKKKYPLVKK